MTLEEFQRAKEVFLYQQARIGGVWTDAEMEIAGKTAFGDIVVKLSVPQTKEVYWCVNGRSMGAVADLKWEKERPEHLHWQPEPEPEPVADPLLEIGQMQDELAAS